MKQVLQSRTGLTVVRDVPPPPCPPGSLLVRNEHSVISSGTERSRVTLSQKSLIGKARERPDLVRQVVDRARKEGIASTRTAVTRQLSQETATGYSSAGTVIEVGAGVSGFNPGDRVACAGAGHANHAEIVSVPANLCARIPDGVGTETAALTTIAAIALHGIRLADVTLGDRVAVVGAGLVGQIACRLLQAAGAEVYALDIDAGRVEQALAAGADHAFTIGDGTATEVIAATGGIGIDQSVITAAAPSNAPLLLAGEIARDRGTLVVVGDVPTELPRSLLYGKELTLKVSRSYGPGRYDRDYEERGIDYPIGYVRWTEGRNMEAVLSLQARGRLDLADLIEEVLPVDSAVEAYARLTGPPEERPRGALVLEYPKSENGNGHHPAAERKPAARPATSDGPQAVEGPVRIGLIGPGGFASRVVVPALTAAGAELELVGGGSGPSAEAATRQLGFKRFAQSEVDVIEDGDVNAVAVCTRHITHAELVARALDADKHVFCEKPLAMSIDEVHEVVEAARDSAGIVAAGFNRRFAPMVRELREFLKNGQESAPITATFRVAAGNLPEEHWTHDLEQGGGRLIGEGCHFVDTLTYLAGSPVVEVHAMGHGQAGAPVQARDNVVVNLTFEDGSVGTVAYVADGSPRVAKERLEAFCGKRTAVLGDYRELELFDERSKDSKKARSQDKGHNEELRRFVEGVREGRYPVPLEEVANVSLATVAIVESLRTGRPVRVEAI